MTNTVTFHPICRMSENAKFLRDRARFAAKAAHDHAAKARKTTADIAALDIEGTMASVHKMVALIGGKSRHVRTALPANGRHLPLAAE